MPATASRANCPGGSRHGTELLSRGSRQGENADMRLTPDQVARLRRLMMPVAADVASKLAELRSQGFKFKKADYPVFAGDSTSTYRPVVWGRGEHAPPNFSAVFGSAGNYDTVVSYDQLVGLEDAIAFVASQPALHEFLWPARVRDALVDDYLVVVTAGFAITLFERHVHLAGWDVDHQLLDGIFDELVAYWIREDLEVTLVVPVLAIDFATDELQLDDATALRRLSDAEQRARWPGQSLGEHEGFVEMATHALEIKGWQLHPPDHVASLFMSAPPDHIEEVDRFFRALAAVTDAPFGHNQVLMRPVGWAHSYTGDLPPLEPTRLINDRIASRLTKQHEPLDRLDDSRLVHLRAAYALDATDNRTRLAAERLLSAELRASEADRIVDLCIGLEALLADASGETTFKIAVRGVATLAHSGIVDASDLFRAFKRVYGYRSAIVHGSGKAAAAARTTIGEVQYRTEDLARMILRRVLATRTADPSLTPEVIDDRLICAALDRLAPREEADARGALPTVRTWLLDIEVA